jgi:hypothetical protein
MEDGTVLRVRQVGLRADAENDPEFLAIKPSGFSRVLHDFAKTVPEGQFRARTCGPPRGPAIVGG